MHTAPHAFANTSDHVVASFSAGQHIPCMGDLIDVDHFWLYVCDDDSGRPLHIQGDLCVTTGQAALTHLHPACRLGLAGVEGWSIFQISKCTLKRIHPSFAQHDKPLLLKAGAAFEALNLLHRLSSLQAPADQASDDFLLLSSQIVQLLRPTSLEAANDTGLKIKIPNGRDAARLHRLMDYVKARLGAPLSLEDFAKATGMSIRGVHLLCKQHYGMSPMELLRKLRLEAVHERLLSHPESHIGEIALQYGFGHLGRFSQYYRMQFGELPTETRTHASAFRAS